MKRTTIYRLLVCLACLGALPPAVTAQTAAGNTPAQQQNDALLEIANTNVVGIVAGSVDGLRSKMIADIGHVLGRSGNMRVVPILSQAATQNVVDLFSLRGADISLVQSDVLSSLLVQRSIPDISKKLKMVAHLLKEELHILAHRETRSLADLAGSVVNFGLPSTGTPYTAARLFRRLGIKVRPVSVGHSESLRMIREGEIAATVVLRGKPVPWLARLPSAGGLHLLSIPRSQQISQSYGAAKLTSRDYPDVIRPGESVDTVAVDIVMIARNWPARTIQRRKISKFAQQLIANGSRFGALYRHRKWQDLQLAAGLAGWDDQPTGADASRPSVVGSTGTTARPARRGPTPPTADELYQEFRQWSAGQNR